MKNIKEIIKNIAFDLGFDAVGFTSPFDLEESNNHFLLWREMGFASDMNYLKRENPINAKPKKILPDAKSIITLIVNYYTKAPVSPGPDFGRVASYAVGLDYHKVLRKKINEFIERIKKETTNNFVNRGFSDSVPLLEKSVARNSGLGFSGKNTLLINKSLGSYFFICEIISNLDVGAIHELLQLNGTCGKCTRCIDVCPTGALHATPLLDSRLCISYLTIENRGIIQEDLRKKIGNWLFGCDLCQEVCPYNKKIKETTWKEFKPSSGFGHWIRLKDILSIQSDDEFHQRFYHTALTRPGRSGLIRNACIVASNNLSLESLPYLKSLAENDHDPVIREHAEWALERYKCNASLR